MSYQIHTFNSVYFLLFYLCFLKNIYIFFCYPGFSRLLVVCSGHQNIKDIMGIQEDSWTPHAPSGLPWPGFGEQLSPSPRAVYSGLAFFSLIRVGGGGVGGGGTTTGMMAVNFRLFTTQDWSLTSEWTHLNRERERSTPTSPPFFYRPCFLQPSKALCTHSSHPIVVVPPILLPLYFSFHCLSV